MKQPEKKLNAFVLKQIVTKYLHIVFITALIFAIAGFFLSEFILPRKYGAQASLYIETNNPEYTKNTVKNCTVIFTDNLILRQFCELEKITENPAGISELRKRINASPVGQSDIIKITVLAETPRIAEKQTADFAELCMERYKNTIASENGTITLVSPSFSDGVPVYPKTALITLVSGAMGLVGAFLAVIYIEIHDTKVKANDDLFLIYKIPVYAEIENCGAETENPNGKRSKPLKNEYKYE